jgi:hypothetical protein
MHYFSTCSGFFAPSTSNPSLLSATKINVTCVRQGSGYIFSLGSILQRDINPSILALADEAASKVKNVDTRAWIILWYTGISTCFLTLCGLPFSFSGRRRHVNLRNFITSGVCALLPIMSRINKARSPSPALIFPPHCSPATQLASTARAPHLVVQTHIQVHSWESHGALLYAWY